MGHRIVEQTVKDGGILYHFRLKRPHSVREDFEWIDWNSGVTEAWRVESQEVV